MKKEFYALYDLMANSDKVEFMHIFGNVQKEMMEWFIANKPELAQEWIGRLEAVKWHNYLTHKEAEKIVGSMNPQAPWSYDQWKGAMEKHGFEMDEAPYYNRFALFATMNMIMSDSSKSISEYVDGEKTFAFVHSLAVDKLKDRDGRFMIRSYFSL